MIELMMINHDQDGDDNDENLFGCKVDEEREKEDHETVKEKTKQGRVPRLFFGTCLDMSDS